VGAPSDAKLTSMALDEIKENKITYRIRKKA